MLVAALSFAGLITYALYPADASVDGQPGRPDGADHADHPRRVAVLWGCTPPARWSSTATSTPNNVAAVPSLHAAFSLLIAITLWPRKRKWLRPIVALYPLAMAFSLVYAGEHYFSDIPARLDLHGRRRVRRPCR